jgi:hypothetical protein
LPFDARQKVRVDQASQGVRSFAQAGNEQDPSSQNQQCEAPTMNQEAWDSLRAKVAQRDELQAQADQLEGQLAHIRGEIEQLAGGLQDELAQYRTTTTE